MGIYIANMEKPKKCFECPIVGGYAEAPGRLYCPAVKPAKRVEGETLPDWCQIEEVQQAVIDVGRQVVENITKKGGIIIKEPMKTYECDRMKKCNTSPICGKECTRTKDPNHAAKGGAHESIQE